MCNSIVPELVDSRTILRSPRGGEDRQLLCLLESKLVLNLSGANSQTGLSSPYYRLLVL